MTATSHQQLETILCVAVEIADLSERSCYLAQACGDDADLRQEVERMVANHFRRSIPGATRRRTVGKGPSAHA